MPLLDPGTLALVALAALLLAGALSPLETLGWWAGWYGDPVDERAIDPACGSADESDEASPERTPEADAGTEVGRGEAGAVSPAASPWVVYLTGIQAVGPVSYADADRRLLARLADAVPSGRVVEVFPYSVTNRALTGERTFARVWRWALRAKLDHRRLLQVAGFLINLRNLWQVLVSADRRYGPFYSRGSAELIVRSLRRRGYPLEPGPYAPRIVLVGYSGGAQVAAGAAPFVRQRTHAEVTVVSLGGVLAADPGLLAADRVWHLYGTADRIHRWTSWMFPGRWRLLPWSPWNVARHRGRLREVAISPCDHTGVDGYLDEQAHVRDGRSYFEVTLDVLAAIARGDDEPLPVAA